MIYTGIYPGKDGGYAVIYPYNDIVVGAIEGDIYEVDGVEVCEGCLKSRFVRL